jgi:hypothetical protein
MRRTGHIATSSRFRRTILPLALLTLLAFFLRVWQQDKTPPGWRDDELINSLVISQKVIDGDWAVYYPDASGHEALYHILNAAMLALFGPGEAGIRLLSAILGTLTVPLTFLVARRLFGRAVGFLAAAMLAVSFWSLMYSRVGIRHISLPVFMLPAFYFVLRGLAINGLAINGTKAEEESRRTGWLAGHGADFLLAGLFMAIGFYTYFASRGIPLILLAFCLYLLLFQRERLRRRWPGLALTFALAAVMAMPLVVMLGQQPESEARVEELAVPLVAAQEGDFDPLLDHVSKTLGMFHAYGDEEWLYNIPLRPVFGPVAAIFFWSGVAVAAWYALRPLGRLLRRSGQKVDRSTAGLDLEAGGAFVLIWWLAGISPGFVSVPAASLGHTIIAQSATYVLAALPVLVIGRFLRRRSGESKALRLALAVLATLLLAVVAWRDLPDYFVAWPERGMTRFLYRADIRELAHYLNENPEMSDFGVGGFLAGPWDRLALSTDLHHTSAVRARWFNPERATLLATGGEPALVFRSSVPGPAIDESNYTRFDDVAIADFSLFNVNDEGSAGDGQRSLDDAVCFQNGLCAQEAVYDSGSGKLSVTWTVSRPLDLAEKPLISNPPPPGVYAGPRLLVFAQLLDDRGRFLAGDDGLWVDEATLWPGDMFRQVHFLLAPEAGSGYGIVFGLYDPMTGQRIVTDDGRDHIEL